MPRDFDPELIDQLQLVENIQRADLAAAGSRRGDRGLHRSDTDCPSVEAARRLGKPLVVRRGATCDPTDSRRICSLNGETRGEAVEADPGRDRSRTSQASRNNYLTRPWPVRRSTQIRARRSNRESSPRVVHFNERFLLEAIPTDRDPLAAASG